MAQHRGRTQAGGFQRGGRSTLDREDQRLGDAGALQSVGKVIAEQRTFKRPIRELLEQVVNAIELGAENRIAAIC